MTYSANSHESQYYGVCFVKAAEINGSWNKYDKNSVLQKPGNLVGVGHSSMFTDTEGKLTQLASPAERLKKLHFADIC